MSSETPRVDAVAPVDAFVTDSDQWAVSKTDYDCLIDVARQLERELSAANRRAHYEGTWHNYYVMRDLGIAVPSFATNAARQELPASTVSAASVSPLRGGLGSDASEVQQPAAAAPRELL